MKIVSPLKENNSISSVAFALEVLDSASTHQIEALIKLFRENPELKNDFPRVKPTPVVSVQIGQQGGPNQVATLGGATFDRVFPDGKLEHRLIVRQDAIIYHCSNYTNWDKISVRAYQIFKQIQTTLSNVKVARTGLEYIDIFNVSDVKDAEWKVELFNRESSFLPRHVFECDYLWHVHHGFFSTIQDLPGNCLNNINIDLKNTNSGNQLVIRSNHRYDFESPIFMGELDFSSQIPTYFDKKHGITKDIMKEILSSEMKKNIGMA
ncbi:hypothetical protein DT73_17190 [Mangrovibacter sp. MFB070]|uniref:TIGR04255 family protein n=1 Tax=Mangrovibacter sp. MFB070 TaxID=1224318 RepID=UPI0004D7C7F8|nr:TIGR04255 family protein [Mangrovibacter sp. MFB070]KEA51449.1 hypothetical protein DT73_17190 [Mangrovibacter sp. MFB070]